MPKEVIHTEDQNFMDIAVSWGVEGVVLAPSPPMRGPEIGKAAGRSLRGRFAFCPEPGSPFNLDGKTATVGPVRADLDRKSINQLIKVLRRARDAAYGRDE